MHCGNQRVCAEGKRCLGAASHQAMSVLQLKIEGYARNDDAREALSKLRGASIFLCAAPPLNLLNLLNPLNLFRTESKDTTPEGLTLNPEPDNLIPGTSH